MKNKTIFCTIFLLVTTTMVAQISTDTLVIKKGLTFQQNQKTYTFKEVPALMHNNKQAYEFIQKARTQSIISNVLSFAGGGFIGWPLGTAIAGGEANWTLAAIGAGLIVVAIPVFSSAKKNATKAVQIYNEGVQTQQNNLSVNLGVTPQGVGLQINF